MRIAINGLGSIGRTIARVALRRRGLEIVAVNDVADTDLLARLLQYDSVFGRLDDEVTVERDRLLVAGRTIRMLREPDPGRLPWRELGVDLVIESTGSPAAAVQAARHLRAGAGHVIITAPAEDADLTVVMGVNSAAYDGTQRVLSTGSCAVNCAAVMADVLHREFGIVRGLMTTVHAREGELRPEHAAGPDLRRARAAAHDIVPMAGGSAHSVGAVLPELAGRLAGTAMRVPVADGSVVDLTVEVARRVTAAEVNDVFREAADGDADGILVHSEAPLVSADIVGSAASCTFDAPMTMTCDAADRGSIVKTIGWYDNTSGFAHRTLELAALVAAGRAG